MIAALRYTPHLFNTPHNRRDLRQRALDAIDFICSNPAVSADTTIALLRRLAHQSEAAMTRAGIESIEKQDIRRRNAGNQAPRENRKKLTATLVMDSKGFMKLESEQQVKEAGGWRAVLRRGRKAKRRQRSLQNQRHIPPPAPLDSAYRS